MVQDVLSPPRTRLVTGEELARMPNMGRSELVEGRLVMLSPTGLEHGDVELSIGEAIKRFVRERKLGRAGSGEVGLYTRRDPDTVRGADVMFMSHERLAKLGDSAFLDVAPELIVEVLSPDDRWSEVRQKLREYFEIGVALVAFGGSLVWRAVG